MAQESSTKGKATIRDIAQRVGVSAKTVSNVINNRSARYSPETKKRILEVLDELDYHPNQAARYMRSGRIGVLALGVPDIANPYFGELAREMIGVAKQEGYTFLINNTADEHNEEISLVRELNAQAVAGIILNPMRLTELELKAENVAIPMILLGERVSGTLFDHVAIDNVAAARMATEHLLQSGRRRIGVIGLPADEMDIMPRLRFDGYVQALQTAGLAVDKRLIARVPPASFTYHDGVRCMEAMLTDAPDLDAVFCFNDRVALGAMRALKNKGIRIPGEVAVVGFDNIEESVYASPSLTTIAPDKQAIAAVAVRQLIARIEGNVQLPPKRFTVPFSLQIRESSEGFKTNAK